LRQLLGEHTPTDHLSWAAAERLLKLHDPGAAWRKRARDAASVGFPQAPWPVAAGADQGRGRFDPEEFDPAKATKAMRKGLPDWWSMAGW
jgi:hypothetical protein